MGKLYCIIFFRKIITERKRAIKLITCAFPRDTILLIKNMLALSFPSFSTGTGHNHWFHALVVEWCCFILNSDKRETYQVNYVKFSHDACVLFVIDWKVKPLSTSSSIQVILQHQIICERSCLKDDSFITYFKHCEKVAGFEVWGEVELFIEVLN